ncbi:MAG: TRAP transporter small permease subunit [Pseudomonadota bacterium]
MSARDICSIGRNVRVEVLIRRLSPASGRTVEAVTAWLALIFVALTGWQAVLLVISDYEHNSRLSSLLLTPSWMPKTPIAVGMIVLAVALLVEIERLGGPGAAWRRSATYGLAIIVTIVLLAVGPGPPMLGWLGADVGSVVVLAAIAVGAFIANGRVVGVAVLAAMIGSVLVYELVADWGVTALTVLILATIAGLLAVGMRIAFALGLIGLICIYLLTPTPFPITLPDRT